MAQRWWNGGGAGGDDEGRDCAQGGLAISWMLEDTGCGGLRAQGWWWGEWGWE